MNYEKAFEAHIGQLHKEGRYRVFADLKRRKGSFPGADRFVGGTSHEVTVWCSNDYLGMGQHPKVLAAMHEAIDLVGAGSGGTRNIAGTSTHYHVELEHELADLHGKEAALVFTSAYRCQRGRRYRRWRPFFRAAVVFSDEKNHASMIAGIRNGRGPKRIWRFTTTSRDLRRAFGLKTVPYDRRRRSLRSRACIRWTAMSRRCGAVCDLAEEVQRPNLSR